MNPQAPGAVGLPVRSVNEAELHQLELLDADDEFTGRLRGDAVRVVAVRDPGVRGPLRGGRSTVRENLHDSGTRTCIQEVVRVVWRRHWPMRAPTDGDAAGLDASGSAGCPLTARTPNDARG
jgi:hypothetical protein